MLKPSTPIEQIPRIQKKYRDGLTRLGIKRLEDLLFHVPARYDDFSHVIPIRDVTLGEMVSVQGKVVDIRNIRTWKKRMILTEAIVEDISGAIKVIWFNQPFIARNIKKGNVVSLSGKVTFSHDSEFLSSPSYEVIGRTEDEWEKEKISLTHTGGLVAVYPESAGVTSRFLRYLVKALLPKIEIKDFLPDAIRRTHKLLPLHDALTKIHSPKTLDDATLARRRLEFDELFLLHLLMGQARSSLKRAGAPPIPLNLSTVKRFVKSLPFSLTNSQRLTAWEIVKDMEKPDPMNRLLEGDVGSGKTVVAALAALNAITHGFQAAIMAPTEILAEQHFKEFTKLLAPFDTRIGLITGGGPKINDCVTISKKPSKKGGVSRKQFLQSVCSGDIDMVIGTHALIQEHVRFKNLGFVIIDEQHRFGVAQRAKLAKDHKTGDGLYVPHFLSMTATPIPRTLALTIYGDLDISLLKEMPKGRKEIVTKITPPAGRDGAYAFLRKEIASGRQAFIICPLIEESEVLQVKSAVKEYEHLSTHIFPDLTLGLLHGRLGPKEKEETMRRFRDNEIHILVSTAVVEVGIDIANATVMIIEGAERFGLAQLYQFRGRVGRSAHQSYCFLFTDSPAKTTTRRLNAIIDAKNSFELAEKDLAIRGPGQFYGVRQSGIPDISMQSLTNMPLIKETKEAALSLLRDDPGLSRYPLLKTKLQEFQTMIHLE